MKQALSILAALVVFSSVAFSQVERLTLNRNTYVASGTVTSRVVSLGDLDSAYLLIQLADTAKATLFFRGIVDPASGFFQSMQFATADSLHYVGTTGGVVSFKVPNIHRFDAGVFALVFAASGQGTTPTATPALSVHLKKFPRK